MNYTYQGVQVDRPTLDAVRSIAPDYEIMLVEILRAVLERYERDPSYPFVDTKLDIFTGNDFCDPVDRSGDVRGKTAIYGAIQGRGLEALVGQVRWLPSCHVIRPEQVADWVPRLTDMVASVCRQMEALRPLNNGCVPFLMTPEGRAFTTGDDGRRRYCETTGERTSIVDVFYAKGLLAAATLLGKHTWRTEARDLMRRAATDLMSEWPGSIGNAATEPGPRGSGMLAIGALALFGELLGEEEWFDLGAQFVRHVLHSHVDHGQFADLELYDHTEYLADDGSPWRDERGPILLDPGHCLEFVGLASKLLLLVEKKQSHSAEEDDLLVECREVLPKVFARSFALGFNRRVGGIGKSVDLLSGEPINSDMPWWSLPETMRAASELLLLCPSSGREVELLGVIADCSNAFVSNYVRREVHLMAYQTIDATGKPVDVIPLTSDLDPGYHTGLCIIDFLRCLDALSERDP